MPPPQKGSVRFTPEEIKALMDAGEMTMPIIQSLHPADLKVWQGLADQRTAGGQDFQKMTAAAAGAGGVVGAIPGAVGKVAGSLSGIGSGVAAGLGLGGANWVMQKLGIPAEGRNAVTMGMGFGMMGKSAKAGAGAVEGEAAAMGAEEAAIREQLAKKGYPPQLIDKLVKADGRPAAAQAATPTVPGMSNVTKEGPLTGSYPDVNKGFHPGGGLFEFPNKPSGGGVADQAGFQRALEEELKRIQAMKGLTNSNASTSGYDAWVAEQEGQLPPNGTSIDDLATKGLRSLRRSPK